LIVIPSESGSRLQWPLNIKGAQIGGSKRERDGSEPVFVESRFVLPKIIASQVHMLPCEQGQVGEKVLGNVLAGVAQGIDDPAGIDSVPVNDSGHHKIESRSPDGEVFLATIAEAAEAMEIDGAHEAVAALQGALDSRLFRGIKRHLYSHHTSLSPDSERDSTSD
jgi:hypothetical protein